MTYTYGDLVRPGETLEQAWRRIDARRDAARVVGTREGQALLEALNRERDAARRAGAR